MYWVHLFVGSSVSKITEKIMDGFLQYFDGGPVSTQNRQEFSLAFL